MRPSERDSAAVTVPDPSPSTPERDEASGVDHSGLDDAYLRAARAATRSSGDFSETSAVVYSVSKSHRAAVDAAREDLAAEVARVTAERDQAQAMLARVRAKAAEWSAEPPWSDISWAPAGTWIVRMIDGEA